MGKSSENIKPTSQVVRPLSDRLKKLREEFLADKIKTWNDVFVYWPITPLTTDTRLIFETFKAKITFPPKFKFADAYVISDYLELPHDTVVNFINTLVKKHYNSISLAGSYNEDQLTDREKKVRSEFIAGNVDNWDDVWLFWKKSTIERRTGLALRVKYQFPKEFKFEDVYLIANFLGLEPDIMVHFINSQIKRKIAKDQESKPATNQ